MSFIPVSVTPAEPQPAGPPALDDGSYKVKAHSSNQQAWNTCQNEIGWDIILPKTNAFSSLSCRVDTARRSGGDLFKGVRSERELSLRSNKRI